MMAKTQEMMMKDGGMMEKMKKKMEACKQMMEGSKMMQGGMMMKKEKKDAPEAQKAIHEGHKHVEEGRQKDDRAGDHGKIQIVNGQCRISHKVARGMLTNRDRILGMNFSNWSAQQRHDSLCGRVTIWDPG